MRTRCTTRWDTRWPSNTRRIWRCWRTITWCLPTAAAVCRLPAPWPAATWYTAALKSGCQARRPAGGQDPHGDKRVSWLWARSYAEELRYGGATHERMPMRHILAGHGWLAEACLVAQSEPVRLLATGVGHSAGHVGTVRRRGQAVRQGGGPRARRRLRCSSWLPGVKSWSNCEQPLARARPPGSGRTARPHQRIAASVPQGIRTPATRRPLRVTSRPCTRSASRRERTKQGDSGLGVGGSGVPQLRTEYGKTQN